MNPDKGTLNLDEIIQVMVADPLSKALWENAQLQVLVRQQAKEIAELRQVYSARNGEATVAHG